MYKFERIMVGLDLTLMDKPLIEYAAFLHHYFQPQKIYFVNIQEDLDVPDDIREQFPEFAEPRDEVIKQEMKEKVGTYFPDYASFDVEFDVIEGSPRKEMLRWVHVKNIDLLLVGRKKELKGSGLLPQQLARKVPCSVLFIPEKTRMSLRELLVPLDFSEFSRMALEEALEIGKTDQEVTIHALHTYEVPQFYKKTGKTEKEFAIIMQEHAKERYQEFVQEINLNGTRVAPLLTLNQKRISPAVMIHDKAHEQGVDMIIIGARGRDNLSALFLGSVSEKLIQLSGDIPILVIKRKNKTFSLFDLIESV
jgi:nucleotide-binding universal stress UspA family protein